MVNRDFKKLSSCLFKGDIQENLSPEDIFHNDEIHTTMCNMFNRKVPFRKKYIFPKRAPFHEQYFKKQILERKIKW